MDLNAFVYGDVVVVTRILSQIAMIFEGNAFIVAAKLAALIGIVIALWSGIARGGEMSASTFFWPLLVTVMIITPRVNLVIEDKSGSLSRVDDLPIGFAAPVSFITSLGYGISEMLTENLGLDDNAITMDNGHLLTLRAPFVYQQIITDPTFHGLAAQFSSGLSPVKDTLKYVSTCLKWDAKSNPGTGKLHQIQNTSLADLRVGAQAMAVGASNGITYECDTLYDALITGFESADFQDRLNDSVNEFFSKFGADTTTGGRYQAALETITTDLGAFYALAAFSNALQLAPNYVTKAAGGGSHEAALQDALNQRREKNFGSAAVIFETISQTIAFVEVWCFSIIPLMLLLLLLGGAGIKMAVKYMWMLVWVQLWYPTILITISFLDASTTANSVAAFSSVANFNAFMADMTRLQDVGYLYLSMATALSMFLVFGTSNALGAAMQRDMAGRDHYDEKKNAPDTLARQPHYSFLSGFTHSQAKGYVGVESKDSYAGASFTFEGSHAEGVSLANIASVAAGHTIGTSKAVAETEAFENKKVSGTQDTVADIETVGHESQKMLGVENKIEAGQTVADQSRDSDAYVANNSVGANLGGQVGTGGASPVSVGAGVNLTKTDSHQETQQTDQSINAQQGVGASGQVKNVVSAEKSEGVTTTNANTHTEQDGFSEGGSHSKGATEGSDLARTDTESETQTAADMRTKQASRVYDAIAVSNGIAGDDPSYDDLMKLVYSTPQSREAFEEMLEYDAEKLDNTFTGENEDKAKHAFAAMYVLQGLQNPNLFPKDVENGMERMEALNILSDEIMARTGFGGIPQRGGVNVDGLNNLDPADPAAIKAEASEHFLRYELDKETMQDVASRVPLRVDGKELFESFTNELGMDLDKLNQGQMNGMLSSYRERLDANREKLSGIAESFMEIYRAVGLRGALQEALWKSSADVRRDAVIGAYDDAKAQTGFDNSLAANEDNAGVMLSHRMEAFKEAGVATDDSDLARYMALTQLEAGAVEREGEDSVDAQLFAKMRQDLIDQDPVLQNEDVARRIEAFAMTGASPEAMKEAYVNAKAEYGFGEFQAALEGVSGHELRADGHEISWSSTPDATANGDMDGGGSTFPERSAEDLALTYVGSLEGPGGYRDFENGATPPPRALTSMTIGQVKAWQADRVLGEETRAAGRYQITAQAWDKAMEGTGLTDKDMFSERNQDIMGLNLLEHHGFSNFMSGPGTDRENTEFGHNLSREWAALPRMKPGPEGESPDESYYEGVQGNKSQATVADVEFMLEQIHNAPRAGRS